MKRAFTILCMSITLGACTDPNVVAKVSTFKGNTLKIITSPDLSKKGTIIRNDPKKDELPTNEQLSSPEFAKFYKSVTGCTVDKSQKITVTYLSGKPFSVLVPKSSCS